MPRAILLAVAVVLLSGPASGQHFTRTAEGYQRTSAESLAPGIRKIEVYGISGSVSVKVTGSEPRVELVTEVRAANLEKARERGAEAELRFRTSGSVVRIDGAALRSVSHHVQVYVPRDVEVDVDLSFGDVEVNGTRGNARVRTASGDIVVLNVTGMVDISSAGGRLEAARIEGRFRATTSGGDIDLRQISGTTQVVTAGGDVDIREMGAGVKVSTAGGNVDVRSAAGDVEVSTAGGDIRLDGGGGRAELSTAGGNISVSAVAGAVEAGTSGGDIDASGLSSRADLETLAGDVTLRDVTGPLRVKTQVGDVDISLRISALEPDLVATSRRGDIDIHIPEAVSARLEAAIREARGLRGHDIVSDFPITREPAAGGVIRSQGTFGQGAGRIRLEAQNGSIRIRSLRD